MVDLDKFICSLLSRVDNPLEIVRAGGIFHALKVQGLEYKEGAIKPIKEPVNFEEFPRDEQLKWYICIKSIPQKDDGFMPLFCEGEHATIEKIFDMLPELKNDTALFTEHFRKVTEVDLPKEKPSTIKFDEESPQTLDEISKNGYVDMNRPIELTIQDEPDFERMEAEYCTTLDISNGVIDAMIQSKMCSAYRKGLEDMWNKLVYKEV